MGAPRDPALIGGPKPMLDAALPHLHRAVQRAQYVPSLAYRIAMVAEGTLDATFIKPNAQDWDVAAADLILAEAGGQLLRAIRLSGRSLPRPIRAMARLWQAAARCFGDGRGNRLDRGRHSLKRFC